jgi:hypothetical protein
MSNLTILSGEGPGSLVRRRLIGDALHRCRENVG